MEIMGIPQDLRRKRKTTRKTTTHFDPENKPFLGKNTPDLINHSQPERGYFGRLDYSPSWCIKSHLNYKVFTTSTPPLLCNHSQPSCILRKRVFVRRGIFSATLKIFQILRCADFPLRFSTQFAEVQQIFPNLRAPMLNLARYPQICLYLADFSAEILGNTHDLHYNHPGAPTVSMDSWGS